MRDSQSDPLNFFIVSENFYEENAIDCKFDV